MINDPIEKTKQFVRKRLHADATGHDWWHIERVWKNAKRIAAKEGGDKLVIQLAALLHDIADWKFHKADFKKGEEVTEQWLKKLGLDPVLINKVKEAVGNVSFGKHIKNKKSAPISLEGKIVQDADRLEALGAIGVARAFTYGGYRNRTIYDPNAKIIRYPSWNQYKKGSVSTLHHFYEKILHLRGMMHTKTAKKIAADRHKYIEDFLKRFHWEWRGK